MSRQNAPFYVDFWLILARIAPYRAEKILEQGFAFALEHAAAYRRAVIESVVEKIIQRSAAAEPLVVRSETNPAYSRGNYSARAHYAGLQGYVQLAPRKIPVVEFPARAVYRQNFGVRSRKIGFFALVVRSRYYFAVLYDDRAYGYVAVLKAFFRFFDAFAHKFFVVRHDLLLLTRFPSPMCARSRKFLSPLSRGRNVICDKAYLR